MLFHVKVFNRKEFVDKKRLLLALITVIGIAQLSYSGVNYWLFKNAYIDMAVTSKSFIENIVEKNLTRVYAMG